MAKDAFNLSAPPGFRGLHPHLPVATYQRHLPHWRQDGATCFVTFRLADALPQQKLQDLKRWRRHWERTHPEPRTEQHWAGFARQHFWQTERWMDAGCGECVFADLRIARILSEALLYFQDNRSITFCYTVMPNHCHVAVQPMASWALEKILDSWKGFVSYSVNQRLGRTGALWQEESYDCIIRDEEHLWRVLQYIGNNPRKGSLPAECSVRWVHPDWEQVGWGFRDS